MNRFQILKGEEPPIETRAVLTVNGEQIGMIKTWKPSPSDRSTETMPVRISDWDYNQMIG